jgi:hypothetical protein
MSGQDLFWPLLVIYRSVFFMISPTAKWRNLIISTPHGQVIRPEGRKHGNFGAKTEKWLCDNGYAKNTEDAPVAEVAGDVGANVEVTQVTGDVGANVEVTQVTGDVGANVEVTQVTGAGKRSRVGKK